MLVHDRLCALLFFDFLHLKSLLIGFLLLSKELLDRRVSYLDYIRHQENEVSGKVEHGVEDKGVTDRVAYLSLGNELCEAHDVIHKRQIYHFVEDLDFCGEEGDVRSEVY